MTARVRTWQSSLANCIAERLEKPFEWGTQDCCLFAADCVQAVTGIDPAAALRGTYDTALGAQRVLDELGGVERIAELCCGPECPVPLAQVGDVGLLLLAGRPALAINSGSGWLAPGVTRLERADPAIVQRAWRCC